MSVMDMNSRMAMAEKLSVQQLQQAVQSGSLPAYIGIPLIEQKTKERAQMAAAQQGQQKPPSVAASILQQADEQKQQERGIDELPSNLPMMEDEEVGMAGGGIIAFAEPTEENNYSRVTDPEQNPRIVALRQDPAYLAFAESGGINGDTSLTAFLEAGNTPTPPRSSQTSPQMSLAQAREAFTPNNASIYNRAPGIPIGEVFSTYADKARRFLQGSESNVPSDLRAYSDRGMFSGIPLGGPDSRPPAAPEATGQPQSSIDSQYVAQDMQEGGRGITAAPGAKLAPDGTPGAPRTAPTGATSAPRTAPQGGGRGALPPTLAAAERSDSPAANQATSMLDKYVAMLEKSGEDVGRQKKEALYMALIQGGLAAAGGMSPNALQNIAQGATLGAQNYQQAMAGIRKDDRARIEKLINAGLSKEKLGMELRKLGIEEKKVDAMVNYYNARAGAAGGSGSGDDNKKNIAYNTATAGYQREVGKVDGLIAKIKQDNGMYLDYTGKDKNMLAKKQRLLADISELNKKKDNMYSQYRSYVTDRLGIDTPDFSGASAGNMPKGIPQGSRQVGTSGGKPVYESPDGKRYIVE